MKRSHPDSELPNLVSSNEDHDHSRSQEEQNDINFLCEIGWNREEAAAITLLKHWRDEKRLQENSVADNPKPPSPKRKSTFSQSNPRGWGCSRRHRLYPIISPKINSEGSSETPMPANGEPSPPTPPLPPAPRQVPILLMTRILKNSDMNHHQNRLSMPCLQVIPALEEFLTTEEIDMMMRSKKHLPIQLIVEQESGTKKAYKSHFRKTKSGPTGFSYAIGKPWNVVKQENKWIQKDIKVDILASHDDHNQLLIFLEKHKESTCNTRS